MKNSFKNKLTQIRLNALKAIYLHQRKIYSLKKKNQLVELLTIGVPVLYFVPRFLFKGTGCFELVSISWEILASMLLVVVIFQLVYKWKSYEFEHRFLAHANRDIARVALQLMQNISLNHEVFEEFNKRAEELDRRDDILNGLKEEEEQEAHRDALKQLIPNATQVCGKCKADPWKFKRGSCKLCGNTPYEKIKE